MRRAFNIIEITITVIILGTLMLLISKGKNVYNNAKFTSDIAKLYKLQQTIIDYKASYGARENINIEILQNSTSGFYVTPQDITLKSAGLNTQLLINNANVTGINNNDIIYYRINNNGLYSVITITNNTTTSSASSTLAPAIIFSCKADIAIDDGNRVKGRMLISSPDSIPNNIISSGNINKVYTFRECEGMRNVISAGGRGYTYLYSLGIVY